MDKTRKQIIEGNEISRMYTFSLGKIPQKVLIEGKSRKLPIVINLHGGPGSPVPFSAGCRGLFPMFTDRFIMVYWDQLGCGINDCRLKEQFGIASFVEMAADLIREIKELFTDNKVILFGMSWGSVLALKVLAKAGNNVDAVLVWGQVLRKLFFNEEVFAKLEEAGLSEKKLRRLREVTPDTFRDSDMKLMARSIRRYTDGYFNKKGPQAPVGTILKGLLTSPDYRWKDLRAVMINGAAGNRRLWEELMRVDLTEELSAVNVPYYILQGDTDIVTLTSDICREVEQSGNPHLHCRLIANSGHIPGREGIDAVLETLIETAENL